MSEPSRVPAWTDLTEAGYTRFRALVSAALARRGQVAEVDDEQAQVVLRLADEGEVHLGLTNLMLAIRRLPPAEWPAAIEAHFAGLDAILAATEAPQLDWSRAEQRLRARLVDATAYPSPTHLVSRPLGPGLAEALMLDDTSSISSVAPSQASRWGQPIERLYRIGRANLAIEEMSRGAIELGGWPGVAVTDSDYAASALLNLAAELPDPVRGALAIAPFRQLAAYLPIASGEIGPALAELANLAATLYAHEAHAVSPRVWWCHARGFEPCPLRAMTGGLAVELPEGLRALLASGGPPTTRPTGRLS